MTGKREDAPKLLAIDLAEKGFSVVPLNREGGGRDPKAPIGKNWQHRGVSDPLEVAMNWPGAEFWPGILTGAKCVVLDVDVKPSKKTGIPQDGMQQLAKLQAEIGTLPDTYTVQTASGGIHLYFTPAEGEHFGNGKLRDAEGRVIDSIDVRGYGGQVIAPGVTIAGKTYKVLKDIPMAVMPAALTERLRLVVPRPEHSGDYEEKPGARAAAELWLRDQAPEAVAGARDTIAYSVACKFFNFGCGYETIRGLIEIWHDTKTFPPDKGPEEFDRWTSSAFTSAQGEFGRDNSVAYLGSVPDVSADIAAAKAQAVSSRFRPYRATEATDADIPLRPWLIPGVAIRNAVTVLAAPGSMGKSLWALQLAFALAIGGAAGPTLVGNTIAEPTKVLIVNNEDPTDELDRRMAAVAQHFELDRSAAIDRIFTLSGADRKFKLVLKSREAGAVEGPEVADLRKFVADNGIGCVVFDPLVSLHDMNETDNSEMQRVMEALTSLAASLRVSVIVLSHTPKPPIASADSYAGTINAIRGATAIKDAARIALTLFGMSEKDGEAFGVPAQIRHRYVRQDDAKMNLTLQSPHARWFKKISVVIRNGEELGVLEPVTLKRDDAGRRVEMMGIVAENVGPGGLLVADAADLVKQSVGFHTSAVKEIRTQILESFVDGFATVNEKRYRIQRDGKSGGRIFLV